MSRPTSYFDRTTKIHTPEAMFRLLEQRTGKPSSSSNPCVDSTAVPAGDMAAGIAAAPESSLTAIAGAAVDRQPLTWYAPVTTDDGGYIRSTCGLYTITKSRSMGQWVYTASYQRSCLQGAHKSADEAKQVAQEHYRSLA